MLVDPQVHSAGAFVHVPDPNGGELRVASPSDFFGTPWEARGPAPRLGEHTRDVLAEMGRSDDDIDALLGDGVVGPDSGPMGLGR